MTYPETLEDKLAFRTGAIFSSFGISEEDEVEKVTP